MTCRKYLLIFGCLFLSLLFLTSCSGRNKESSSLISVDVLSSTYSGEYTGESTDKKPDGSGTFTFTSEETDSDFILTGTWENGLLQGDASIDFSDGTELLAEYKDGLINGEVTEHFSDGSYRMYTCSKGKPYGRIKLYDASGNLSGYDYYYQSRTITWLKSQSQEADYQSMQNASSDLLINPVKITCTVVSIYEDLESTYIELSDRDNHSYIGTYKNTEPDKYAQAIVPNLKVGEEITVYGFLKKSASVEDADRIGASALISDIHNLDTTTLKNDTLEEAQTEDLSGNNNFIASDDGIDEEESETESEEETEEDTLADRFGNTMPILALFTADYTSGEQAPFQKGTVKYENIIKYPYHYADQKFRLSCTVMKQIIDYDLQMIQIIVAEENTSNYYYATYHYTSQSTLPALGDHVVITGTYQGNYKNVHTEQTLLQYLIFPCLSVSTLKII